ncbi:hypothetical protein E2C01_046602 [Portunus trituberculatus]|uniref:Uncharacterized protein n=1 Tax=Portunus trituberculatus TaxID=210409 RepID=A0A5B7G5I7_PORTR|nr:hypothetical protein [Portunus trituberculatus]
MSYVSLKNSAASKQRFETVNRSNAIQSLQSVPSGAEFPPSLPAAGMATVHLLFALASDRLSIPLPSTLPASRV